MLDAALAAVRVFLEGALAWALADVVLRDAPLRRARGPLAAAIALGLAAGAGTFAAARARGLALPDLAPALKSTAHLVALGLLALAFLVRGAEARRRPSRWRRAGLETLLLAFGVLLLLPDGAFLAARLHEMAVIGGAVAPVAAGASLALALAAGAGAALSAAGPRLAPFVRPSSAASLVFGLKCAGLSAGAIEAHTLPGALAAMVSRAVHDLIHVLFVVYQLPDHPYLAEGFYQLIVLALAPAVHAVLAAGAVAVPIALAWAAFLRRPCAEPERGLRPPRIRALQAARRSESTQGAVGFLVSLALVLPPVLAAGAREDAIYDPAPEPVVDDGQGTVVVPLAGPLAPADADRMRKFVYAADGRSIVFFTIRKPDGQLAAALDLCEMCQPKGYAQMGRAFVFCKHCRTPIPAATVGLPGGCNPVPIPSARIRGATLTLSRAELISTWDRIMRAKR